MIQLRCKAGQKLAPVGRPRRSPAGGRGKAEMVYSLGGQEVRYYLVFSCVVGADVYRYMFRDVVFFCIPFFFFFSCVWGGRGIFVVVVSVIVPAATNSV